MGFIICAIGLGVIYYFFLVKPREYVEKGDRVISDPKIKLSADAKVTNVKSEVHEIAKNEKVLKTIVTMSDGFKWISFKHNNESHFMTYTLSLTKEQQIEIINDAIIAHNNEYKKQNPDETFESTATASSTVHNVDYTESIKTTNIQ